MYQDIKASIIYLLVAIINSILIYWLLIYLIEDYSLIVFSFIKGASWILLVFVALLFGAIIVALPKLFFILALPCRAAFKYYTHKYIEFSSWLYPSIFVLGIGFVVYLVYKLIVIVPEWSFWSVIFTILCVGCIATSYKGLMPVEQEEDDPNKY